MRCRTCTSPATTPATSRGASPRPFLVQAYDYQVSAMRQASGTPIVGDDASLWAPVLKSRPRCDAHRQGAECLPPWALGSCLLPPPARQMPHGPRQGGRRLMRHVQGSGGFGWGPNSKTRSATRPRATPGCAVHKIRDPDSYANLVDPDLCDCQRRRRPGAGQDRS